MEAVCVNGVELRYQVTGSGEPVLLISTGPIADSFRPLASEESLSRRYRLIRYRQRRMAAGTDRPAPVSFAEHAADAAALLEELGIDRAHVAGHSTGAAIALQLAVDSPGQVHSLALLEPTLMSVPSAGAFFEMVGPAVAAYGSGDREGALAAFMSVVCSLAWDECRTHLERHVPGSVAQAIRDADDWFASYLPALNAWRFGREQAAAITQPVLSVLGTETERLFSEGHDLLHAWFPQVEDWTIEGVAHLLHIQRPEPVAQGLAGFFARHAMGLDGRKTPPGSVQESAIVAL